MNVKIEPSWHKALQNEFDKPYFAKLSTFVREEYNTQTVFPPASQIFEAFNRCPLTRTKVVLIGQDPYHNPGQAHGLCFSVNKGVKSPPSLVNIYKELTSDIGGDIPQSGDLSHWANQGVLMLNATLTVRAHQAASHQKKGWETFTDAVIDYLANENEHIVFLLWGNSAIKRAKKIDASRHLILTSAHPSPLSAYRGYFGNHHFSLTNEYLIKHDKEPINWL